MNPDCENQVLASYAMHSADSRGRVYNEAPHPYRGPFQRDRDRIVHSSAYRRLAHKTQVFIGNRGDYHRTRLTHTLEVASIARTVGRALRLNEDLVEALALMHDIGHPPFGHAGEEVLNRCTSAHGGFNHNQHAVRLVTQLEDRYPEFSGLNLSYEVLSGQENRIKSKQAQATSQPLLEVQVVDAADSIAYDSHDADDALELGLLQLDDLLSVPLWHDAARRVQQRYTSLDPTQLRRAVIHQLIETLVSDLIETSRRRIDESKIGSAAEVMEAEEILVAPSKGFMNQKTELEQFLRERVYRHSTVLGERKQAVDALHTMFHEIVLCPDLLPKEQQKHVSLSGIERVTCDYLAALTDRSALERYEKTREKPQSRS